MQSISLFIMNDHLNNMKLVLYPSIENHYYHIIRGELGHDKQIKVH